MSGAFQELTQRLQEARQPAPEPRTPRAYRCSCGRPVYFRNSFCIACNTTLGYLPGRLAALLPMQADNGEWRVDGEAGGPRYKFCANREPAACNWMLEAQDPASLCFSCRLSRTIPDLSFEANRLAWQRIEFAKRQLVSQLLGLGVPVEQRVEGAAWSGAAPGLAFDFLRPQAGQPVLTGHLNGVVTLNIEEADDAERERRRSALREPYRTLLGHLRHEVGHYYWDRLVAGSHWHAPFRGLFGDERADYGAAIARNIAQDPPPDWSQRHVSAYASAHPWEDWAETWAHYLHMVDTLDTALSFGLHAMHLEVETEPFKPAVLEHEDAEFLQFVNSWVDLTVLMNAMSRSMGQHDFYPFVLSAHAVRKLHFVHRVVCAAAGAARNS